MTFNINSKLLFDTERSEHENIETTISITDNEISFESSTVLMEYVIGVRHVSFQPSKINGCGICMSKLNRFVEAADTISDFVTGYWMIFALTVQFNKNQELVKPRLRRILFSADNGTCNEAVRYLNELLGYNSDAVKGKRLLFLLNPASGSGMTISTFNNVLSPMLEMASLRHLADVKKTEKVGHATTIIKDDVNLHDYRVLTTVSGDGLFHEMVNGIFKRPDWASASQIPVALIGTGTANAVGKNIDTVFPELGLLALLKGNTRKIDLFSYWIDNEIFFSHLNVLWAFVGDVDIESEQFRSMGEARFVLQALVRLFKFRHYKGKIFMLPPNSADLDKYRFRDNEFPSHLGPQCLYTKPGKAHYQNWPIVVEDSFEYFLASTMPWISGDFLSSPKKLLNDGLINIQYGKNMTKRDVLSVILDGTTGKHITYPFIHSQDVKAFVLEPGLFEGDTVKNLKDRILNVSGERIPYQSIQVEVHKSAISLITPKWNDSNRWKAKFLASYPCSPE